MTAIADELKKWEDDWAQHAHYDGQDQLLSLRGLRGGTTELKKLSFFKDIKQVHFEESSLSEDWFQLINKHDNITTLSFQSVVLPPTCILPKRIHNVKFCRMRPENVVAALGDEASHFTQLTLKEIEITHEVYARILQMKDLFSLDIESTVPPGEFGVKNALRHLRISQLGVGSEMFLEWVKQLRELTYIELAGIRFVELNSALIKNAKTLIINFCEIASGLPEYEGDSLSKLVLSNLNINELPKSYANDSLEILEIRATEIRNLPGEIGRLKKIETLAIAQSKIINLPKEMLCARNIKRLDLSGLSINYLPSWIREIKNLEYMDISESSWKDIPEKLIIPLVERLDVINAKGQWLDQNSRGLFVKDLKIESFDPRYLTMGYAKYLLPYFYRSSKQAAHETTLFVLGATEYQRKYVIRTLLEEDLLEEMESSHGLATLNVSTHELAFGGRFRNEQGLQQLPSDLRVHIREVISGSAYDVAHPIFFLDYCLYIVVIDGEDSSAIITQATQLTYLIEQKAPNAYILFCLVCDSKTPAEFTETCMMATLRERIVANSCILNHHDSRETNQMRLSDMAFTLIKSLPVMEWKIPLGWQNIKKHVESLFKAFNHIGPERFDEICRYFISKSETEDTSNTNITYDSRLISGIKQWLSESGITFIPSQGTDILPGTIFNAQWFSRCIYGVLFYAERSRGATTFSKIWNMADENGDESILETNFLHHNAPLITAMRNLDICILGDNNSSNLSDATLFFPIFRSIIDSNPIIPSQLEGQELSQWLRATANVISMAKKHYVIEMSILTREFYEAFLCALHDQYCETLEEWNTKLPQGIDWRMGREGALFAFPPKAGDQKRSGCLLVTGTPGCPGNIHVYASGVLYPRVRMKWAEGLPQNTLAYASVAIAAFDEALRRHQKLDSIGRHGILFEERVNERAALIPLEDIKKYKEAGRRDYYCAPLRQDLNVVMLYQASCPKSHLHM